MESMQDTVSLLQKQFVERMDSYESQLQSAVSTTTITALSADFTTFRSFILITLHNLQNQVEALSQQIDTMEMRSRRKILLIHGLPESRDEDTTAVVAKVLADKLKIANFSSDDTRRSHRMGRMSTSDRPRPILFELSRLELRDKIWRAKTELKGSGITLSEFLTKSRHAIFTAARLKLGISKCWTRDGFIYILGDKGERRRINTLSELEKIEVSETAKPTKAASSKEAVIHPKGRRAAVKK